MSRQGPAKSAGNIFTPRKLRSGLFFQDNSCEGWLMHAYRQADGSYILREGQVFKSYETMDLRDPFGFKKELGLNFFPINVDIPEYRYQYTGNSETAPNLRAALIRMDELRQQKLDAGCHIESGSSKLWLMTRMLDARYNPQAAGLR